MPLICIYTVIAIISLLDGIRYPLLKMEYLRLSLTLNRLGGRVAPFPVVFCPSTLIFDTITVKLLMNSNLKDFLLKKNIGYKAEKVWSVKKI